MVVVAFIGMDGSGKTTIIKHIIKETQKLGIGCAYYHGFYNPIFFPLLKFTKLLSSPLARFSHKKSAFSKERSNIFSIHQKFFIIIVTLWHIVMFIENLIFFLYCRFFKSYKKIVIFDRFWIDRYVYLKVYHRSNVFLDILYQKIYPHLIKPEVIVYLSTDPHIAHERKREEHPDRDVSFFKSLKQGYDLFINKIQKRFCVLDFDSTINDPEEISKNITRVIIARNLNKFLPIIRANRTEYNLLILLETNITTKKIEMLKNELSIMERDYMKALSLLEELRKKIDFVVYKTHNLALKKIPRDIDILVKDEKSIKDFMVFISQLINQQSESKSKVKIESQLDKPWEVKIALTPFYKIEISLNVTWFGYTFIPNKMIFDQIEYYIIMNKYKIAVPSKPIDFLIRSVHAFFGDFYIRYDEYLHLLLLLDKMKNEDLMYMQQLAQKIGWGQTYLFFIKFLEELKKKHEEIERIKHGFELPTFPVTIPYSFVVYSVVRILLFNLKYKRLKIKDTLMILTRFIIHFAKNFFYRTVSIIFYTKTYKFIVQADVNKSK